MAGGASGPSPYHQRPQPATIRVFAGPRCGPARAVGRGIGSVGGGGGSGIAAMSNGACSES